MVDKPIYRLTGIDVRDQLIGGSVAVAPFVEYALTMDLFKSELVDELSADDGSLPLRDRYLPVWLYRCRPIVVSSPMLTRCRLERVPRQIVWVAESAGIMPVWGW